MNLTLIQLVSEQTMQNLLPLLAIKPAHVIHVRSRDASYAAAARHIEEAAREAGSNTRFEEHPLPSECPDVEETRLAVSGLLSRFPDAIVNVTGGTKLMGLGAYLGAVEFPVPILYCDTDRQSFISLGKRPTPALPSFKDTARSLSLRVVMAAHGKAPNAWRFDVATPRQLEFGRRAFDLRWRRREEFQRCDFGRRIREFFRGGRNRISSGEAQLRALCSADLCGAVPDPIPPAVREFLKAASDAGFLQPRAGGFSLGDPPTGQSLRNHVEHLANLLDGSWFELSVLDLVRRSPTFADAHWSVEPLRLPERPEAQSFGETDVVCLALPQGALQVISCKTSLEKPLEHIEALRERSHNLGGRYAQAALAVLSPRSEQIADLRRWGKLLSVEVLLGDDVVRLV